MNAALKRFALVLALASLAPVAAAADQPKRPITAQDLWAVKRVGAPALSPDGKWVAYSVQEWSIEKNKSTAALWLTDVASASSRRLTAGTGSDTAPAWSPDGSRIASGDFMSDFAAKRHVTTLRVYDVASGRITDAATGVTPRPRARGPTAAGPGPAAPGPPRGPRDAPAWSHSRPCRRRGIPRDRPSWRAQ